MRRITPLRRNQPKPKPKPIPLIEGFPKPPNDSHVEFVNSFIIRPEARKIVQSNARIYGDELLEEIRDENTPAERREFFERGAGIDEIVEDMQMFYINPERRRYVPSLPNYHQDRRDIMELTDAEIDAQLLDLENDLDQRTIFRPTPDDPAYKHLFKNTPTASNRHNYPVLKPQPAAPRKNEKSFDRATPHSSTAHRPIMTRTKTRTKLNFDTDDSDTMDEFDGGKLKPVKKSNGGSYWKDLATLK